MEDRKTVSEKTYRSTGDVIWVNDSGHLLVVNKQDMNAHWLRDDEAALWRWLHQDFSYSEILALYCALTNIPAEQGEMQIWGIFQGWIEKGLLEVHSG